VVSGFATALVGPADGKMWHGTDVEAGPAVHSSARARRAWRPACALALWSGQRLKLGVVNTYFTRDNSKNLY
jgi:nucleotide-binding universal stress UspA family protein